MTSSSLELSRQRVPQIVNVKVAHLRPEYSNLRSWMANPQNVYIGRSGIVFIDKVRFHPRASPWANPFVIGRDGDRDAVCVKYEHHIRGEIAAGRIHLDELRGKAALGCWCRPSACHGDILLKLLAETTGNSANQKEK